LIVLVIFVDLTSDNETKGIHHMVVTSREALTFSIVTDGTTFSLNTCKTEARQTNIFFISLA
jgi:hypothetical protein